MGSRSKIDLAYIAGFLDGDGSLMLQIKKRKDGRLKRRFMATICFYQDGRHETPLGWIREKLGIGYLSRRNDGMSELRINGFRQVRNILENLLPYIRFKEKQARALLAALHLLLKTEGSRLDEKNTRLLAEHILAIQDGNYVTKRKKTREELFAILGLTP